MRKRSRNRGDFRAAPVFAFLERAIMANRKPYDSDGVCPSCNKPLLQLVPDDAGELAGVKCKCGHVAELKPFPLPGACGYFVGDDGRVYSIKGGRHQPSGLRALSVKLNHGVARVRITIDGTPYYPYLAPVVLEAFGEKRPPGFDVEHADGNRINCALSNIAWTLKRARQVTAEMFVRVWQESDSPQEVADKLGMEYKSVVSRACNLRKHNVPLKNMAKHGGLDWDALAKIASEAINGDAS